MTDYQHNGQPETEPTVARVVLVLIAVMALLALTGFLLGAPAPLARHERAPGPCCLPRRCVIEWYGQRWDAEFYPNGTYRAGVGNRVLWEGTWRLEGWTLIIHERYVGLHQPSDGLTHHILMSGCMRRGAINGRKGSFVLIDD